MIEASPDGQWGYLFENTQLHIVSDRPVCCLGKTFLCALVIRVDLSAWLAVVYSASNPQVNPSICQALIARTE